MSHLAELVTENCTLYADIEGFKNPSSLFESVRPDIVLIINNVYHIVKLTVCFETNLLKSHDYKARKYKNIGEDVINKNVIIKLYPVEFSCLGFTSKNLTSFTSLIRSNIINVKRLVSKCSEVCCRTTYYIFNRRGKSWEVNDIMKYI